MLAWLPASSRHRTTAGRAPTGPIRLPLDGLSGWIMEQFQQRPHGDRRDAGHAARRGHDQGERVDRHRVDVPHDLTSRENLHMESPTRTATTAAGASCLQGVLTTVPGYRWKRSLMTSSRSACLWASMLRSSGSRASVQVQRRRSLHQRCSQNPLGTHTMATSCPPQAPSARFVRTQSDAPVFVELRRAHNLPRAASRRSFQTMPMASAKILRLILLSPTWRSTNTIGTSATRRPFLRAR